MKKKSNILTILSGVTLLIGFGLSVAESIIGYKQMQEEVTEQIQEALKSE